MRSAYIHEQLQAELLSRVLNEQIRFFALARCSAASAPFAGNVFEAIVHRLFGSSLINDHTRTFPFKKIMKKGRGEYEEVEVSFPSRPELIDLQGTIKIEFVESISPKQPCFKLESPVILQKLFYSPFT